VDCTMLADSLLIAHPNHRLPHKANTCPVVGEYWLRDLACPTGHAVGAVKDPLTSSPLQAAAPSHIFVVTGRDS